MLRKYLTCFLIVLLLNLQLFAQTKVDKQAAKEAARTAQLKAAINTIGTGDTAPAELKLKTNGKLIGYVSEIKDGSIVFAETAIARSAEIPFAEIDSIKAYKPKGKSNFNWGIALGIGVAVVAVVIGIKVCQAAKKRGETCQTDEQY